MLWIKNNKIIKNPKVKNKQTSETFSGDILWTTRTISDFFVFKGVYRLEFGTKLNS